MTLHKLSAGEGYTYLTRQVAAHDATERRQAGLSAYYAEKGETPGRWLGSGLHELGLVEGGTVTESQMVALFGLGHHPRQAELGMPVALGREFPTYAATTLRMEVSQAFSAYNREHGRAGQAPLPVEDRARIRTEVAHRRFVQRYHRVPVDARELAGFLAEQSRPPAAPVAGYDLTFSPVKSVSALWALAPGQIADQVVAAHDAAVADVIGWLERDVAFTRTGAGGLRQVPVRGLVAAAFTHRDSRAGDPDLHTHVAVSNKVQSTAEHGNKWLALDGRVLFKAKVAACERYNTRLEAELVERLGVRFVDRRTDLGKRAVREIEGIDPNLLFEWSKRRFSIQGRTTRLAGRFQAEHGRPPTRLEEQSLAQQANLDTRQDKHEPRSEAEQRATWRREAEWALRGSPEAMVASVLGRSPRGEYVDLRLLGHRVLAALEASRATWQTWHVRAEAERQARAAPVPLARLDTTVDTLVEHVVSDLSVPIDQPDGVCVPAALRRIDGVSVYDVHGMTRHTSRRILDAEQTVLEAARRSDGRRVDPISVGLAVAEAAANRRLDPSQAALVTALATSGARVQVALAPAGTGKTTTMRVLADAWRDSGGNVLGLAPSAVAAHELGYAIRDQADTLAKLVTDLSGGLTTPLTTAVGPNTLLLVDEAGMAATTDLATVVTFALDRGASVRLVGDDQQLASVAAGGLLRDLVNQSPATSLSIVHRFASPAEAAATLAIRAGDPTALGFYTDHQRIHVGDALDHAYRAWRADRQNGLDSVLLAPTRQVAIALNERARCDRLAGASPGREAALADGTRASGGDLIVSRNNDRRLSVCDTDWVKNGDRWQVTAVHRDGSVTAARLHSCSRRVWLPAAYVAEHVQLGYAATVHSAQGMTVDTSHTVLNGSESRQLLYVALSRGRVENHLYLATDARIDDAGLPHQEPAAPLDVLRAILARDGAQESATTARRDTSDPAARLHQAVLRYCDGIEAATKYRIVDHGDDRPGPLPWLPAIPQQLADHPTWATYLRERSDLVTMLAEKVALASLTHLPRWSAALTPQLTTEIAVWRAASGVPDTDPRPTGPRVDGRGWGYQRRLDRQVDELTGASTTATSADQLPPTVRDDQFSAQLEHRLTELYRRRRDLPALIQKALDDPRPLPAENAADALWWRVIAADASTPRPAPKPMTVPHRPKHTMTPNMVTHAHCHQLVSRRGIGR